MTPHTENLTQNANAVLLKEAIDEEISLLDVMLVIATNLRLLIIGPLTAGLIALGVCFLIPPVFTAETTFIPPQQQQGIAASMLQSLGAIGGLAGAASGLKNPSDQYIAFTKSTTVEDALVQRFDLLTRYEKKYRQDARKVLEKNSYIGSGKDGLITVTFDDKDPSFAAEVANAYVEELGRLLNRLAVTEAQQRRMFFEKQLTKTNNDLTKAQQALAASGVGVAAVNANPAAAIEGPARLRAQITALEVRLASMRSYLTESSAEIRQAQTELSALRSQLAKTEREQPSTGENDYIAKLREFKYQETLFELFAKQFELAKVDESKEGAFIQIVDPAKPPEKKSKPKKLLIAAFTALGTGLILLIFIFARSSIEKNKEDPDTRKKISDLRNAFKGAFRSA